MTVLPDSADAAILPPANPGDTQPSGALNADCYPPVNIGACNQAALAAINAARAGEGVGPMVVPTNFFSLNFPEQLLVVANLERVDRGEVPFTGLSPGLSALAAAGAASNTDPPMPSGTTANSLWIGGWTESALFDDFFWMYDDGPGGVNEACAPWGSGGCWGHRDAILREFSGPALMGAASVSTSNYPVSVGEVYAQGGGPASFTWAQELAYLTYGVSVSSVDLGGSPGQVETSALSFSASGSSDTVHVSVSGGGGAWSVSSGGCWMAAGHSCSVGVSFRDPGAQTVDASLDVSGPGGSRSIPLDGGPWNGYWLAATDGGIFSFGTAQFKGSTGGVRLWRPIVGMAATPDNEGYWLVASDGGVFSFGDARFYGSTGGVRLHAPIVGMARDPRTGGYWLVASDGGIFSFNAPFYGSMGDNHLDAPIVGMTTTPDGRGYWLVASDGGIFSFGDARFYGSTGGHWLRAPIIGMTTDPATGGYWLLGADGGIFSFHAPFYGSTGGKPLDAPVVSMQSTPNGGGYWFVASDGGVFTFGNAKFDGSTGGVQLNAPVIALSS